MKVNEEHHSLEGSRERGPALYGPDQTESPDTLDAVSGRAISGMPGDQLSSTAESSGAQR
ncbi:hypothetical protein GN958_ATG13856 [Phytophthora infestans]|uniref:Uncharacterized protein n=1 Tax=Phytophthora infestans TaxID=4787 RepID=A0A8S9UCD6_PHYIN|nr:hypothetical protein GN958_ATG13856 [Phytophthora infestans]